ncbi:MAG: transposase [Ktedonobacteraceae bacterium]
MYNVSQFGIDVGLNRLATLPDGMRYENQRPLRHLLKRLRRMNKELARRAKGGKNWQKTKSKLARLHYRIACLRADVLHKLTTQVAKQHGLVAVKDLPRTRKVAEEWPDKSRRESAVFVKVSLVNQA